MDKKVIVTHDVHFHADEIFAVAALFLVIGKENTVLVRSRDEDLIKKGDYVVDVGGEYDEAKNRFDHHQKGGAGVRENSVAYASFGLVWKKFGVQLCGNAEVAFKIDKKLVQPIDLIDNGVQFVGTSVPGVFPYGVGEFFESLYPSWKEDSQNPDVIFLEAVLYAQRIIEREIIRHTDKLAAEQVVRAVYDQSPDKRLIILDQYVPTSSLGDFPEPLFVIFPHNALSWRLKTIRKDENSFVDRKALPKEWGGRKSDELEKITGVSDVIFCHPSLFIAGAKTKEAVLKLAEIALNF